MAIFIMLYNRVQIYNGIILRVVAEDYVNEALFELRKKS
jgi:hypothetical protein